MLRAPEEHRDNPGTARQGKCSERRVQCKPKPAVEASTVIGKW